MRKCDLCKRPATHSIMDANTSATIYVCDKHIDDIKISKNSVVSTIKPSIVATTVCSLCGKAKSVDEFYAYTDKRGVKRRRSECKTCNLMERKIRRLRKK